MASSTSNPPESGSDAATSEVKRFFVTFFRARGAAELLVVSTLLAVGLGSIVSLIPISVADRYARLHYEYDGDPCGSFDRQHKPEACQYGSDEAQSAAAWSNFGTSILSLLFSPVLGSMSDKRGRRVVLMLGLFLNTIPSAAFLLMLRSPKVNPTWYYTFNCLSAVVQYLSIAFAMLSDIIPDEFRAQSYGIVVASFYGGLALSASMPIFWSANTVALISFLLLSTSFVTAAFILPETLVMQEEIHEEENQQGGDSTALDAADDNASTSSVPVPLSRAVYNALMRPFHEVAILNRNWLIRLIAASAFLSSMVTAADTTLVIYYVEEELNVRVQDFAGMILTFGIVGIIFQAGLIQPAVKLLGEKALLLTTFLSGILHNTLYGLARSKETIFCAVIIAQWTRVNSPILSSLASKGATSSEQGRVQGALFATNAIAYAIGPLTMNFVYSRTQNTPLGPGFMFFYAAGLYLVGAVLVSLIPVPDTHDEASTAPSTNEQQSGLEEPLLDPNEQPSEDLEALLESDD